MIRVGDEVVYCGGDYDVIWELMIPTRFVVTKVFDDENKVYICGFDSNGTVYGVKDVDYWKPTGRYFPEVEELLEKMRDTK